MVDDPVASVCWPNVEPGADWVVTGRAGAEPVTLLTFDGTSRSQTWEAPEVHLVPGETAGHSLMPWLNEATLILRDEAIYTIGPVLADFGELLRLRCPDADLVAFNALNITDAMDVDRSRIKRWTSGAATVQAAVFGQAAVELGVFKWSGEPGGPVYLTEAVVQRLTATQMTRGTNFPPSDVELPWY